MTRFITTGKNSPGQQDIIPSSAQQTFNLGTIYPPETSPLLTFCLWFHQAAKCSWENTECNLQFYLSLSYRFPSLHQSSLPSSPLVTTLCVITEYLVQLHPDVSLLSFPKIPHSFILSALHQEIYVPSHSALTTPHHPLNESGYTVLSTLSLTFFLPICSQPQMRGLQKILYSLIYSFLFLMIPTERKALLFCTQYSSHLLLPVPVALRADGLRMILSRALTICSNLGLWTRSFCQQSSISRCKTVGQSGGGGRR